MNKIKEAFSEVEMSDELRSSTVRFIEENSHNSAKKFRSSFSPKYAFAAVMLIALIVIGTRGYSAYMNPVAYISVDVNPSIELGLDKAGQVVSVQGYNDDGEKIVAKVDLKGMKYDEAVEFLIRKPEFKEYLTDESELTITVAANNEEEQEKITKGIEACNGYKKSGAVCNSVNSEEVEKAHKEGLSLGKYNAYKKLKVYDKEITAKQCANMTMKEIHDRIRAYGGTPGKNQGNGKGKANNNGGERGQGHQGTGQQGHQGNGQGERAGIGNQGAGQQGSNSRGGSTGNHAQNGGSGQGEK